MSQSALTIYKLPKHPLKQESRITSWGSCWISHGNQQAPWLPQMAHIVKIISDMVQFSSYSSFMMHTVVILQPLNKGVPTKKQPLVSSYPRQWTPHPLMDRFRQVRASLVIPRHMSESCLSSTLKRSSQRLYIDVLDRIWYK